MIDSHGHYDDDRFSQDCDQILLDLKNHKINKIINIACDVETSKKAIELSEKFDFVYATIGYHPNNVFSMTDRDISELIELSKNKKVVAWGEIGLDFHYDYSEKDIQIQAFKTQLEVAKSLDLPVVIHSREATEDMMKIMRDFKHRGVFHCYSGSLETAKEIIKMGYYISFSGTVTYKNSKSVKEVAKWIPKDKYLIETDCPYLSPEPMRGTRNDSRNLIHTASCISELRGISLDQLEEETMRNTKELFLI
jgi:TatD DNase family protein